ncbi:MAG: hypothetical protein FJ096_13770 [Deltaproteobacteria bacterium]|nr:hypothetical protein [Deltaproteobacteria bacterium]
MGTNSQRRPNQVDPQRRLGVPAPAHARSLVRSDEARALAASTLCLFAILAAHYVLKSLRSFVLQTHIGVDRKSVALVISAASVAVQTNVYSRIVTRTTRLRLVTGTFALMLASLVAFALAYSHGGNRVLGYLFYAWVSGASLLLVSQFWSVATEAWTHEQGLRLFGIIGIGAVAGSIGGNLLVIGLGGKLGLGGLFALAAALLLSALVLARWLLHWSGADAKASLAAERRANPVTAASLVAAPPYLAGIAVMSLLLNVVNTSNEWGLDKTVAATALAGHELPAFYGRDMLEQNVLTFALQVAATSPIQRKFGPRAALLVLPTISVLGGLAFVLAPSLGVVRTLKVAENAAEYSIHANTRELLYDPVTSLERYNAKSFNDTFVVRAGDSLAAGAIFFVVEWLGAGLGRSAVTLIAVLGVVLATVTRHVIWRVTGRHRAQVEAASARDESPVHLPAK